MNAALMPLALSFALAAQPAPTTWQLDFATNRSFERDINRDGAPDGWKPSTSWNARAIWGNSIRRLLRQLASLEL